MKPLSRIAWWTLLLIAMGGCASLQSDSQQTVTPKQTFVYSCEGQYRFVARIESSSAWLFLPGVTVNLPQVPASSASRYQGAEHTYVRNGEQAILEIEAGRAYHCTNDRAAAIWEAARLDGADFRAVGNEPGWWLTIGAERMVFVGDYGKRRVEMPVPEAEIFEDQRLTRYRRRQAGADIEVELRGITCNDSMSGEAFPVTVKVIFNTVQLHGCGRALH